jgi:hypothetical protein
VSSPAIELILVGPLAIRSPTAVSFSMLALAPEAGRPAAEGRSEPSVFCLNVGQPRVKLAMR